MIFSSTKEKKTHHLLLLQNLAKYKKQISNNFTREPYKEPIGHLRSVFDDMKFLKRVKMSGDKTKLFNDLMIFKLYLD